MIEGIYQIGSIQEKGDFLEEFIEDIGENNYKHVFKIVVDISKKDNYQYKGIEYEEFDSSKKIKYFYKKGSSKGTDKTPTSKITEPEKTLNTKIYPIFKNILNDNEKILKKEEINFLKKIDDLINKNKNLILQTLKEKINEIGGLKTKEGGVITFIFKDNNKNSYVGDLEIFRNIFKNNENEAYKSFYYSKANKVYSKANNKLCYICGKNANEVWGFVNTYNFYTVDKESYVAGGLNRENAWRNYPVCSECAKILERGKKFADKNLIFKFCGFTYYLIPELLIPDKQNLKLVLNRLKKYQDFSLSDKKATLIENVEEAVLRDLAEEGNHVNFNFLFFEKSNSAFKILLYMQEIPPSRLKYLISAKDNVDNYEKKNFYIFKEIRTKKDLLNFNFSFSFVRDFFPNNKFDGNFNKHFLSLLNNIFIGKKISADFLFSRFMEKISQEFLNDNWIDPWVLKSYKILIYLETIKLLERRKSMSEKFDNEYEKFFIENSIFDDDLKKALFLEGVLVQFLLDIQYQERNATPFRSRLNGLKIDEKVAKRLLPETINKLEEYGKNYYRNLEKTIGKYLLNADFKKYSVDEMSYYFTLGMVLAKHFKSNSEQKENKEEN